MSSDNLSNNKRIAKNTLMLYFRTFVTMIVGLYTGRVMLDALGVENYGINNVVGGIVAMSGLLTSALSKSCSRYITYTLGKGDLSQSRNVFSTVMNAQIIMALIVAIALETVGLWFLNTTADIPGGRLNAANWVLHCSVISVLLGLISVPYNSTIVAHEHMSIYAYMSIVDVVLKLAICLAIMYYGGDRLILLSCLTVGVAVCMRIFYGWYCTRHFEEAKYELRMDRSLLRELTAFSGWNMLGSSAWLFNTHGLNMLINVFFGVTFNAARGVANTVNSCVQSFIGNFGTAFQPQITKSYAKGDLEYCYSLTNKGTKFTWLMMYIFVVPVCMEADILLDLWLVEPPAYAALFLRLAMFESLAVQSGHVLYVLIQANGNIKRYQIEIALTATLIFPLTWLVYALGAPVWSCYVIFISIYITLINWVKFRGVLRVTDFPLRKFFIEVFKPCLVVSIVSFTVPLIVNYFWEESVSRFFIMVPLSVLWTVATCYVFGLTSGERKFFVEKAKKILRRK